jgi:hypothetical protein
MAKNEQRINKPKNKIIEKRNQGKEKKVREKRSVGNRKYGQGQARHAKKGIYSCVIAVLILVLLFVMLGISYVSAGETTALLGAWGIGTLILAWVGLMTGIKGLREREKNYMTCRIGIWCNVLFIVLFLVIFVRGLL